MRLLIILTVIPLTVMVLGIVAMIYNYSGSYNRIMANLKVINTYNMNFKSDMEYSMYRVMIGLINTKEFENGDILEGESQYATVVKNPFHMIEEARYDMEKRITRTPGSDGDISIKGILSCLDSLEKAVQKMVENSNKAGRYDENSAIWENDIPGLCSMIQDYINKYIYYETRNMENLQRDLEIHTRQSVYTFMVLLAVILTTGIMFSAMLTNSVTRPISSLKMTAERLGNGDWNARAETGSLEEINVLARTFNQMSEEIAGLIERIRKEQKNLHIAEMKLLQAQINPHFLYNTLESIRDIALEEQVPEIAGMSDALARLFRYNVKGQAIVPLSQELEITMAYLDIQKARFPGKLEVICSVRPEAMDVPIMKFLLQPLVENAVFHGIEPALRKGTLFIGARVQENRLLITIQDDGIGIPPDQLAQLQTHLADISIINTYSQQHVGILNVAHRILLNYGKDYRLTLDSEPGEGTRILLTLPAEAAQNPA